MVRNSEIRELGRVMNTSKGIDEDWFSEDLEIYGSQGTLSKVFVTFWFNSGVNGDVSVTFDGTNYAKLNDGANLKFDNLYTFEFYCSSMDKFNIRVNKSVTVYYCVVGELEHG